MHLPLAARGDPLTEPVKKKRSFRSEIPTDTNPRLLAFSVRDEITNVFGP